MVEGALGNRLLRSLASDKVVNIAYFASQPQYEAWRSSALFEDHLARIRHLVEMVEPDIYSVAYNRD